MSMTARRVRSSAARFAVASLVLVVGVPGSPLTASAGTVNVPALTFVPGGDAPAGDVLLGLLANGGGIGSYYAFTPLSEGDSVCRVMFWARDNDGDFNLTARLMRKKLVNGAGTGFGPPPEVMATLSTIGASVDMQRIVTNAITSPLVSGGYDYWVELEFPGGFMEAFNVRIITAPVC